MTINPDRIRERSAELKQQSEVEDMERGYCQIINPPYAPKVSDYWSEECFKRIEPELDKFLAEYAALLLESKMIVQVGPLPKLLEWREMLRFASQCSARSLSGKCRFRADIYLRAAIDGDKRIAYDKLAEMITRSLSDYPYYVYSKEVVCDGYDRVNFDEYYEQKRREMEKWYAH